MSDDPEHKVEEDRKEVEPEKNPRELKDKDLNKIAGGAGTIDGPVDQSHPD